MKYGFIGCGNMGSAVARALLQATKDILVTDRSGKAAAIAKELGISYGSNKDAARQCDRIFLCVKPQMMESVLLPLRPFLQERKPLLITMAAGLTLQQGLIAGIALNPGTSISSIEEILNTVDRVLVLGVNPGYAGRKYQPYVDKKIEKLIQLKNEYNFDIYLDGAVTKERIEHWRSKGVKGFVLGTATLFKKEANYKEIINHIKKNTICRNKGYCNV